MGNDLKGIENDFKLTGASSYRESTVEAKKGNSRS